MKIKNWKLKINEGFTLIEMLVVISLIGMLAAIALVSFGGAQKQARDTTRKSDLKQYQTSLEVYANLTNGLYPSSNASGSAIDASTSTGLCGYLNNKLEPDITCSEDPKNASDSTFVYRYASTAGTAGSATATNYVIWAKMEGKSTTTYLVACSNGKIGTTTTLPAPVAGACPTLTQI